MVRLRQVRLRLRLRQHDGERPRLRLRQHDGERLRLRLRQVRAAAATRAGETTAAALAAKMVRLRLRQHDGERLRLRLR